jgi:tyrosyl-tRNA synthetase
VDRTRPILSEDQIKANAETYFEQAGKILDTAGDKLEIRYNSQWLNDLSFAEVLKLASRMTVAQMLERDTFAKRYKGGSPIGIHEFIYPLMQGYDSVVLEADVELGATDQTFNCLVGRQLQRDYGQSPQVVMVMPMLVGLDGTMKMSKSKGNYVGVAEPPGEMFGKLMSIPDGLMPNYYDLCTAMSSEEAGELLSKLHPKEAKIRLAKEVVTQYHSKKAADAAAEEFERVFAQRKLPTDIPLLIIEKKEMSDGQMGLARLIVLCGFAQSNSAAMSLIKQNAVSLDQQVINDPRAQISLDAEMLLKVGKRRFARVRGA